MGGNLGDSCVEKPLTTLWRNYTQNHKPDVVMRIQVCPSGLKATTRQHGLTEYWSNRITHCSSPKNYPRIFCWIYRHEGRKLKHELRCHAVLCPKETMAEQICKTLKVNVEPVYCVPGAIWSVGQMVIQDSNQKFYFFVVVPFFTGKYIASVARIQTGQNQSSKCPFVASEFGVR